MYIKTISIIYLDIISDPSKYCIIYQDNFYYLFKQCFKEFSSKENSYNESKKGYQINVKRSYFNALYRTTIFYIEMLLMCCYVTQYVICSQQQELNKGFLHCGWQQGADNSDFLSKITAGSTTNIALLVSDASLSEGENV